jgi:sec-independent protein translocase protein TatA
MCGHLGMGELLILLLIVVVVFGVGKLPQLGDALGRSVKNFKKAINNTDEIDVTPRKEIGEGGAAGPTIDAARASETKRS